MRVKHTGIKGISQRLCKTGVGHMPSLNIPLIKKKGQRVYIV